MNGFGERLKEARGAESQASFARKLGISQVAYSRYELDQREPGLDCLYQIGIITGCSVDWLLGLTDTQEPKKSSVSVVNSKGSSIAIGNGATAGRDCMECPLLKEHLKRFSRPLK